jgi:hypothetical protein
MLQYMHAQCTRTALNDGDNLLQKNVAVKEYAFTSSVRNYNIIQSGGKNLNTRKFHISE